MKRHTARAPEGQVYALAVPRDVGGRILFQLLPGPATRSRTRGDLEARAAGFPPDAGVCVVLIEEQPLAVDEARP